MNQDGSEVVELETLPVRRPWDSEVLIRIKAFGLNRLELSLARAIRLASICRVSLAFKRAVWPKKRPAGSSRRTRLLQLR